MAGASNLLAAWHLDPPTPPPPARPGKGRHSGIHRNADPLYAFPQRRIVKHFVPDSPLRTSSLRSLGAFANVFAIESFMDELAHAASVDPVDFRLRHLVDERAREVIQAAANAAGWQAHYGDGYGQGIAFAQYKNEKAYAAVVADLHVDVEHGVITLQRLTIAADAGQIVNPDGLRNQLEGGAVQAASWTLKECVHFDQEGIKSIDWEHYPVLRMAEAPTVTIVLIDRPGLPPLGAGEATTGPTPAAIANAVYNAVGARLRQLPFTPGRVLGELASLRAPLADR
jgi:CO/xanthine dehydrogenase Mo-binding subunit